MQCESCKQRPATVHQTVIINGDKQESHLCEICAREQAPSEFAAKANFAFPNLSIQQLLSSFLDHEPFHSVPSYARQTAMPRCEKCGMTYSEFADSGRLGCADCYEHLEPYLIPLIKRIHGTTMHGGKAPKRTGGMVRKKRELAALKQQLAAIIAEEKYEEAVRLRDRMREIEAELQSAGGDDFVG